MKPPETITINARQSDLPQSQFRPADIAYILYRHKWKIILFTLTGIAAAATLFFTQKPVYISQAKLLIRYVQENRSVGPSESGDSIRSPDMRGDNILNSEIELITSLDLAQEVAEAVGATNIVIGDVDGPREIVAAVAVRKGVEVESPRRSNVLLLSFRHPDPATARNVLNNLVSGYLRMHARVHRALGVMDDLDRQANLRGRDLRDTEAKLREIKDALGIGNLDEAKTSYTQQLNRVKEELLTTEALLAEAKAGLGYSLTNSVTPSPESTAPASPSPSAPPEFPREKLAAYESVLTQLDALKKNRQDMLLQYTEDSIFVTRLRERIAAVDADRVKIESENPGISTYAATLAPRGSPGAAAAVDRSAETSRIAGLEARWNTLQKQLAEIQSSLVELRAKEPDITELERKRAIYEKDYRYYAGAVEEARVDAALTSGRLANISVVQAASLPSRDTEKLYKLLGGVLGGGLVLGLGLALALELYADQTLRRPTQVTRNLNIPVFLTIPRLAITEKERNGKALLPAPRHGSPEASSNGTAESGEPNDHESALATSPLGTYAEALRDRVIMHFQLRELHHKPKLVGVTSCGKNAGATTLATHLAASLSETGEGNVLYVDANPDLGPSVQAFYRGKQAAGVASALDQGARSAAKVNENFYMVALNDAPIAGKVGVLPKKLANLLPQMKASDFDYIIFDLPPVTQTSATARVAGLLDMTLLVLESEKTHGDLAKQVTGLLKQSRADVAAVLNKHRRYIPKRLDPDL